MKSKNICPIWVLPVQSDTFWNGVGACLASSLYRQSLPLPAHPTPSRLTCHGQGRLGEEENEELEFDGSVQEHTKHKHCWLLTWLWNTATCACIANLKSSKLTPSERSDPTLCTHKHFLQVPVKFTALTAAHWQPSRTVTSMLIKKLSYGSNCFSEKALERKAQEIFSPLWVDRPNALGRKA